MRVLITGGLGNLGLWLTNSFLKTGSSVDVLGRKERVKISHPRYQFISSDITSSEALKKDITKYYDLCIHTASYNEHFDNDYAERALLINALGTDNLCHALSRNGVGKLIYFSTFHVYGTNSGFIDEEHQLEPVNDYGLTHLFAEKYIEKHHRNNELQYVIFRLTNSYGCPIDRNTDKWYLLFNDICKQAMENGIISLNSDGSPVRDFIWMGDVVSITQQIAKITSIDNKVVNLSSARTYSVMDVAMFVKQAYYESYSKNINIVTKQISQKLTLEKLTVSNDKLSQIVNCNFSNHFLSESKNIFQLLRSK